MSLTMVAAVGGCCRLRVTVLERRRDAPVLRYIASPPNGLYAPPRPLGRGKINFGSSYEVRKNLGRRQKIATTTTVTTTTTTLLTLTSLEKKKGKVGRRRSLATSVRRRLEKNRNVVLLPPAPHRARQKRKHHHKITSNTFTLYFPTGLFDLWRTFL